MGAPDGPGAIRAGRPPNLFEWRCGTRRLLNHCGLLGAGRAFSRRAPHKSLRPAPPGAAQHAKEGTVSSHRVVSRGHNRCCISWSLLWVCFFPRAKATAPPISDGAGGGDKGGALATVADAALRPRASSLAPRLYRAQGCETARQPPREAPLPAIAAFFSMNHRDSFWFGVPMLVIRPPRMDAPGRHEDGM